MFLLLLVMWYSGSGNRFDLLSKNVTTRMVYQYNIEYCLLYFGVLTCWVVSKLQCSNHNATTIQHVHRIS